MKDPTETHIKAARYVLRYLKRTCHYKIMYIKDGMFEILGYTDGDHASDKNDRISYTGYIFKICGGLVSWTSHKQSTVAHSTLQAEYMAFSDAAHEAEARRQFYQELNFMLTPILLSDNQSALEGSENPSKYQKIKHLDICYHYIRHQIANNRIILDYIPSEQNPADALTSTYSGEALQLY